MEYSEVQVKIKDAARKLFVGKGLKGTTVRDIAAEANVNVAMVNYYFRSKDKLFETIFEEATSKLAEKLFYLADTDMPFFELVRQWIYSYYDMLLKYPDFPTFVLMELATSSQKMKIKSKKKKMFNLYDKLAKCIQKEEEKGTIHPVPVTDFLLNIVSLSIFPFAASPVATRFLNIPKDEYLKTLEKHKEYVADFVIRAIKKENQ